MCVWRVGFGRGIIDCVVRVVRGMIKERRGFGVFVVYNSIVKIRFLRWEF